MKNKTESNLSRKGVFGSLWRWVKGKIASSCKLSLSISSNENQQKKVEELVKKIQGWDVSYYPGDRINAILDLGAESTDRNSKPTKITWKNLTQYQKEIVLTKLVGFLNRISYGDYTGGPSSNSKRNEFMKNIYENHSKNDILKEISFEWFTPYQKSKEKGENTIHYFENIEKVTNLPYEEHLWCCLTKTKNNKYEDGMNGDYLRLILKYTKPDAYNLKEADAKLSSLGKEILLYRDMENLTNNNEAISDQELLKIGRYNDCTQDTKKVMLDDLNTIYYAIIGNSYYPAESYLRMGIALLKYLKVNEEIYENKNLKSLKDTSLEDTPLILLLFDWSKPEFEEHGVKRLNIEIIKTGINFVIMDGKFSGVSQYYLFYVDTKDKTLKYLRNYDEYKLKQNAKKISALPDDCKKALEEE